MNSTPKNSIRVFLTNPLWLLWLAVFAYLLVVLRSAWLAEDAFITFRTVDNFIHGYGLRWNVVERVQVYTHPLWMFLVSLFYFVTGEIFYTAIFLSVAVSLAAVLVLVLRLSDSLRATVLGIVLLMSSKAFVDYSTSGLENPLTHLLLAIFLWIYLRREVDAQALLQLSLVAALATLNRMDTVLLFFPVLVYGMWTVRWWRGLGAVLLGFVPFFAWELFSLVYYGFLFPNTAYAKLNTGLATLELVRQGAYYLLNSLRLDPLTLVAIGVSTAVVWFKRQWRQLPVLLGVGLYLLYVVRIGGDFMCGRFLTFPFFAVVCLLLHNLSFLSTQTWLVSSALVLLVGLITPRSSLLSGADYGLGYDDFIDAHGIADERINFYQNAGFLPALAAADTVEFPTDWWAVRGREVREYGVIVSRRKHEGYLIAPANGADLTVATWWNVGFSGFYAGPRVHIIDALAITEPLLAHLPPYFDRFWHPGHLQRLMPDGYLETHIQGRNRIADPNLATFYDKIRLISRGSLFLRERWEAIWEVNTGQYDRLIDFKFYRSPPLLEVLLSEVRIRPSDPSRHIALGEEYFKQGDMEKAVAALSEGLRLNPESFHSYCAAGRIYRANQLFEQSAAAYRQAIRVSHIYLEEVECQQDPEQLYNAYAELSRAYHMMDDLSGAIVALQKAIAVKADDANAFFTLGSLYYVARQFDQAIYALQRATELDPDNPQFHSDLGIALMEVDHLSEAEQAYREAIRLESDNSLYYQNLGMVQFQQRNDRQALASLLQAIHLGTFSSPVYLTAARLYRKLDQPEEALQIYRQLLDRDLYAAAAATFTQIGVELFRSGDHRYSTLAYRKALAADKDDLTARTNLGWNLYLSGDYGAAIDEFHQALEKQSGSTARFNLGLAYLASGESDAAKATYARGVEEFGAEEAERIGAVDDLRELIRLNSQAASAREILRTYWHE